MVIVMQNIRNFSLSSIIPIIHTEFKQIIGRGTRLRKDKGKWHLEILDFRNATAKFKDPAFDGDPEPPKGGGKKPKPYRM